MLDMSPGLWPSVSATVQPLVERLIREARELRVDVSRVANGAHIVDAGVTAPGGVEAGRRIAEICLGGLGQVSLSYAPYQRWAWQIVVSTSNPLLACLGSQYAGWSLSHGDGTDAFFSLGSGPGRALAAREDLFKEFGYKDSHDHCVLVLETEKTPPPEVMDKVARDTGVPTERQTYILTPTRSLAGATQIVARVLEVGLHKAHTLGFPLDRILDGHGAAPLCPTAPQFTDAMGRTNDAILLCGEVHLVVLGPDAEAQDLARQLPACTSKDYGRPFAEVFKAVNYDFYKIDPALFAPAVVSVTSYESGRTYRAGRADPELLDKSFGV
jgi:methenyltetrahydromethanopterin cyclohydrolase